VAVKGYYRHPTIHENTVVFVSEDDLWSASVDGGAAVRLTANPGTQTRPRFSPDGSRLAFLSRDEGRIDVFVMPAEGGESTRISFLGTNSLVAGWSPGGDAVIAATDRFQPFPGWMHLVELPVDGGPARPLPIGPAFSVAHAPNGRAMAIGRNAFDPARWKRYRGGRAGSIWVDARGDGSFRPLVELDGNMADPMWIGRRIYFVSDHEGTGNLYSVTASGNGLKRHTHHEDFYVRHPSTDGHRIVYHCGADIWLHDPASGETRALEITVPSARPQRNRSFRPPGKFLESVDLHPQGHSLAVVARGGAYTMPLWEGSVLRHGAVSLHRQRLATWLPDGERFVAVTDSSGEEALIVRRADGTGEPVLVDRDLGRVRSIDPAPRGGSRVAVTNHRHELIIVDLTRRSRRVVHRSPHGWIEGTSWSPDGRWLAFAAPESPGSCSIFLYDTAGRRLHRIGRNEFSDRRPSFDPSGAYLAFVSSRIFDPVADSVFHDHGFPQADVPMIVSLRSLAPSPLSVAQRSPRPPGAPGPGQNGNGAEGPDEVLIDFDGIEARLQALPVAPGRIASLRALATRILFTVHPPSGGRPPSWATPPATPRGVLQAWDLATDKLETVAEGVAGFTVSMDGKVLGIVAGRRLRVVPSGWKDDKASKDTVGRETGWIDLDRVRIEIRPADEWRQMFTEAWRLQRDHYWVESMGGVDWLAIHDRYADLLDRVGSRSEFSDLMWEMQGELGTSHAYEMGGDYRPEPTTSIGYLGADVEWSRGAWRIARVLEGDPWDPAARSPLAEPGIEAAVGDRILAVDGRPLERGADPGRLLVDRAGRPLSVTLGRGRSRPRTVPVVPLESEAALRYRDWVNRNRALVREWSNGRAGYIHIPDMMTWGFSEFHRAWLVEREREGLVIDVRFNRGGNVSQLLMERLVRRRLGYRISRWRDPVGFPYESPAGPMVCVTNEYAGSDGDIFSHTFKLHGLGPLIGTRTWGGVIGIWPQQSLVDGTVTTQPEFSTWFSDVGYGVENYGTDPDIEVVDLPQDYAEAFDRQLHRGVEELNRIIELGVHVTPDFGPEPSVAPPRLSGH
jgi:tricorn protease